MSIGTAEIAPVVRFVPEPFLSLQNEIARLNQHSTTANLEPIRLKFNSIADTLWNIRKEAGKPTQHRATHLEENLMCELGHRFTHLRKRPTLENMENLKDASTLFFLNRVSRLEYPERINPYVKFVQSCLADNPANAKGWQQKYNIAVDSCGITKTAFDGSHVANITRPTEVGSYFSMLQVTSLMGNLGTVRYLLRAGADPSAVFFKNYPPLFMAIHSEHESRFDIMSELLDAGADIDTEFAFSDRTVSALEFSVYINDEDAPRFLIYFGASGSVSELIQKTADEVLKQTISSAHEEYVEEADEHDKLKWFEVVSVLANLNMDTIQIVGSYLSARENHKTDSKKIGEYLWSMFMLDSVLQDHPDSPHSPD